MKKRRKKQQFVLIPHISFVAYLLAVGEIFMLYHLYLSVNYYFQHNPPSLLTAGLGLSMGIACFALVNIGLIFYTTNHWTGKNVFDELIAYEKVLVQSSLN